MNKEKLIEIFDKHVPRTPMTKKETMIMFNLMTNKNKSFSIDIKELDKESEIYKHFKPVLESFQGQVFLKRIENFTSLKMSLGAFVMLIQHMPSPGACVMYTFYLHSKLPENTLVIVDSFVEVFPFGFFSEIQLSDIWNAQKVNTKESKTSECVGAPDNMIDYVKIWK